MTENVQSDPWSHIDLEFNDRQSDQLNLYFPSSLTVKDLTLILLYVTNMSGI